MKNHIPVFDKKQIEVCVSETVEEHTQYAGLGILADTWQRFEVGQLLEEADIHYGDQQNDAEGLSFVLTMAPFVRAPSMTKAAQRFGGEPSEHGQEADPLLERLLPQAPSQRKLSRFAATERSDWSRFQEQRLQHLWRVPAFAPRRKGVLIVDDCPLAKPYAEHMDYLSPIRDSNLKRTVMGYCMVHLYYDLPGMAGYSLYVEPWLKTSLDGQTRSKPRHGARRAREGEERSKLDIALDALEHYLPLIQFYEALLMDGWYTARWFCARLTEMSIPWIGEAGEDRKFQVAGRELWTNEIAQRYRSRRHRINGLRRRIRAVAIPAVWLHDRNTRIDQPVMLVLVTGLGRARPDDKGYRLLVCNQVQWTAGRIVRLFSRRAHIEQVHRDGKQYAGWTDFHTRSLPALLCHLALCLLRLDLLHLCRLWYPVSATYSLADMIDHLLRCVFRLTRTSVTGHLQMHIPSQHPALAFWT